MAMGETLAGKRAWTIHQASIRDTAHWMDLDAPRPHAGLGGEGNNSGNFLNDAPLLAQKELVRKTPSRAGFADEGVSWRNPKTSYKNGGNRQ